VFGPVRHRADVGRARQRAQSSRRARHRGGHDELTTTGAPVSDVFHDSSGGYNRFDRGLRATGPDPERRTYASFLSFEDPDGNECQLQEITSRLPGRVNAAHTSYSSAAELAAALKRAEAAHGSHETRTGQRDEEWPAFVRRNDLFVE
jgi:hypothetical protein